MNKFFVASAIALASLAATSLPSQAATVVIANGAPNYHHRHHDCFTKRVVGWHHGHRVVTEQRVCR
ncbi:hypothetical protein CPY51_23050 [Rhizobium tubonense]|uniref:Uncharacterized protein n=1 Tax=Rhizobium tubonense TaxID=484088 RepID=A0A2W4CH87_9HYPH|nr:hypothetical protein [Rhizobium tubonense]PZM10448.1 hypothetical protein CPY51_23050 [Rhizobium tubonense]